MEEDNKLKNKYSEFIKEISIHELKDMCDKGTLNVQEMPNKIWVIDYLGDAPEDQADFLLNALVANDIAYMVEIKPQNLFKQIYAVKDYMGQQDIVAVFKDGVVDLGKLQEMYPETLGDLTLAKYIGEQVPLVGTYVKEEYDPLGFNEQQAKIDDIDEKLKNGEITFGEALQDLGLIGDEDYDKEKVANIVEKLVKHEMTGEDLKKMLENDEINNIELNTIADVLKRKFPEIDKELNEEMK